MEYPHRQYLLYLLSKQLRPFEIMAECESKLLMPPNDVDLRALAIALGPVPPSWVSDWSRATSSFKRWLREVGILEMWRPDPLSEEACRFLYSDTIRRDFEALVLARPDVEAARDELCVKYPEELVPSVQILERFRYYFWNLGVVSREGVFSFLRASQERVALVPIVQGDIAKAYGLLGLRQRVQAESFYDNVIALAHQQVNAARQAGGLLEGNKLMGLAALSRQAIDAIQARDELRAVGGSMMDEVRKEAVAFKMRTTAPPEIVSIDELQEREPEEEDGATDDGKVKQFPVPR